MSAPEYGFPKSFDNGIEPQIPPFVSSYAVKVVPSNVSSVVSPAQTLGASSGGAISLNGTSQNVIFDLPCGNGNQFYDGRFTTLSFRVAYSITNTPSAAIVNNALLRGSAYSFWDRSYLTNSEGAILDDINLVSLVADTINQLEISVSERDSLSLMYGFNYENGTTSSLNKTSGHIISGIDGATLAAATTSYYSYCVPLINPLIGKGSKKHFCAGRTNKMQLIMQSSALLPLTVITGTATTTAILQVSIDQISLNLQVIDIGNQGMQMLKKTGIQYYDGTTYRVSAATIPASTSGSVSLLTGLRGSSVNCVFSRFSEVSTATTAGCVNGMFDSKMPQATSIQYNVGGLLIPGNPVDLLHQPATAFAFTQEANASFNTYSFKSGLIPNQYLTYVPGGTLPSDTDKLVSLAGNASTAANLCQFLFGYNMEKVSQFGVLDGMNFQGSNVFLNMTLANANTNSLTAYFIAKQDILFIHDFATGQVSSRL